MTRGVSSSKKVLASMIVLGSMSFLTITGTFAIMNSDTSNSRSSIASGTLTFSNTATVGTPPSQTQTTCYSFNGPLNANASCALLFDPATLMYPGTLSTPTVTISNDGSLKPSALTVYMGSCVNAPSGSPNAPSYTNPGAGANPCGLNGLEFYVQETDQYGNPLTCWFPAGSSTCPSPPNANGMFAFANTYKSAGNLLNLGAGPAPNQSRYFTIGVGLPTNASNSLQGQEAQFTLTWGFTQ